MRLKIGYFADGQWAHEAFTQLIADSDIEIVFLCVRYDKRDKVLIEYAEQNKIPLLIEKDINSTLFRNKVEKYKADIFVSMSFNQIFKNEMIYLPPMGTINCHAGKLPFYRGRNILNWALINDEKEFGITVHYVDEGIDTGDIILQKLYPITDLDTYATLLNRAYIECATVLYEAIKLVQRKLVKPIRQDSIDKVGMYCGMRIAGDEYINWNQTSREIFNFVRALCTPGPCSSSKIINEIIKINKVSLIEGAHPYKGITGQVIGKTNRGFYVKTIDTMVEVIEYQYEGKVKIGDRLK